MRRVNVMVPSFVRHSFVINIRDGVSRSPNGAESLGLPNFKNK
jgi:hypothetical protein